MRPIFYSVLLVGATVCCTGCRSAADAASGSPSPKQGFSDLHNSVLYRLFSSGDISGLEDSSQAVSLHAFRQAGAKLVVLSIGIPRFNMRQADTVRMGDVLVFLRKVRDKIDRHYPELVWVGDRADLDRAQLQGKTSVTFALEGSWLLEGNPNYVDSLYDAGVRMMGIAHRFQNEFFKPSNAPPSPPSSAAPVIMDRDYLLSPSGTLLVLRMVERGMLIDVSHLPESAFWEVVMLNDGRSRLIASHSNPWGLCPKDRNLTDAQIKAIVKTDGLIGICFHQGLYCEGESPPDIADLVDHLAYMMGVAGEDHVALGSDLEGLITPVAGLEKLEFVAAIRTQMRKRGFSPRSVEKVMWKNALRIFRE
jgi:microsomal dipeptidase-like Zn-dependent dipeptidase